MGRGKSWLKLDEGQEDGAAHRGLVIFEGKTFHTTERAFLFAASLAAVLPSRGRENLTPSKWYPSA